MKVLIAIDHGQKIHDVLDLLRRIHTLSEMETTVLVVDARDSIADERFGRENGVDPAVIEVSSPDEDWHSDVSALSFRTTPLGGHTAHEINCSALELRVDLIVLALSRLSWAKSLLLGNLRQEVLKLAPCSVLVVNLPAQRDTDAWNSTSNADTNKRSRFRVLLAFEASPLGKATVERAVSLQLQSELEMIVVTVLPLISAYRMDILQRQTETWQEKKEDAKKWLDTVAKVLQDKTPHVMTRMCEGKNEGEEIVKVAHEVGADLIVMGRTDKNYLSRILTGSVANRVLQRAPCPVWFVKR